MTTTNIPAGTIPAGTPCVIVAGKYFDECGVIADEVSDGNWNVEVLIGSPGHLGERVRVRRSSVELY